MVRLRAENGLTLEEIGGRFGLTRERVRQILARSPSSAEAVKERRREVNADKRATEAASLEARHGGGVGRLAGAGLTTAEIAAKLGLAEAVVRGILQRLGIRTRTPSVQRFSDDDMGVALRGAASWAASSRPLAYQDYEGWRRTSAPQAPAAITILKRFDTWNGALAANGLPHRPPHRNRRSDRRPDERLRADVATYLAQVTGEPRAAGYEAWARAMGAASLASVRHRLGSFNLAITAARMEGGATRVASARVSAPTRSTPFQPAMFDL